MTLSMPDRSLDESKTLLVLTEEDMICFGHHHPVHYFSNHQPIFLNPGSLGCRSNKQSFEATRHSLYWVNAYYYLGMEEIR